MEQAHRSAMANHDHRTPQMRSWVMINAGWYQLLFLPQYSSDLNPIEMALSKLKAHQRKAAARTFDAFVNAIGEICNLYNPDKCQNFFKAAGYIVAAAL